MKRVTKEFINSNPKGIWMTTPYYDKLVFLPKEIVDPIIKAGKAAFEVFKNPVKPQRVKQGYATYSYLIDPCDGVRAVTYFDSLTHCVSLDMLEVWVYFETETNKCEIGVSIRVEGNPMYFELDKKFSIKRDLKKLEKWLVRENLPAIAELE